MKNLKDLRKSIKVGSVEALEIVAISEMVGLTKNLIIKMINSEQEFVEKEALINALEQLGYSVEDMNELNEKKSKEIYEIVYKICDVIPQTKRNFILQLGNGETSYLSTTVIKKIFCFYNITKLEDLIGCAAEFKLEYKDGALYRNIVIDPLIEGKPEVKETRRIIKR